MMKKAAALFILLTMYGTAFTQDLPRREVDYRPGDWVSYPVLRFATSVVFGPTYVYFGTDRGISRYDYLRKEWGYPFTESDGLADGRVITMAYDTFSSILWCATPAGVSYYLPASEQWRNIPGDEIGSSIVTSIGVGMSEIWLESEGEIFSGQRQGGPFWRSSADAAEADQVIWQGSLKQKQELPELFVEGDYQFLPEGYLQDSSLRRFPVSDWAADEFNHLWLAVDGLGGAEANPRTEWMYLLPFGPYVNEVRAMAWDGDAMWIGGVEPSGKGGGVSRWDLENNTWRVFEAELISGMYSDRVNVILPEEKYVWFGTEQGLVRLDRQRETWRTFTTRENLPYDRITALAASGGVLWIGTRDGLAGMSPSGSNPLRVQEKGLKDGYIFQLEAAGDFLWAAAESGLYRYDLGNKRWEMVPPAPGLQPWFTTAVSVLGNTVWAASDDGLEMSPDNGKTWQAFPRDHYPVSGRVYTILADSDQVWFGTDEGLLLYIIEDHRFRLFTREDGLVGNRVFWILLDGDYLWAGTDKGLIRFYWNAPYRVD